MSLVDANRLKVPGVSPAAIQMGKYVAGIIQWFYSYVRYKRGARIITGLPYRPADDSPPRR